MNSLHPRRLIDCVRAALFHWRLFRGRIAVRINRRLPGPPHIDPVWPLPRAIGGPTDDEIRTRFAAPNTWYHDFCFEGGLQFPARYRREGSRPHQGMLGKFAHVIPTLIEATGGSLAGKRVLDIACNTGFWSFQCALLGAEQVVGLDARQQNIDNARFLKSVVGLDNVDFQTLSIDEMCPEELGGTFDVVLNLGLLYLITDPVEAIRHTVAMAREFVLLETIVVGGLRPSISLSLPTTDDMQSPVGNLVGIPNKPALNLIFRRLGLTRYVEIPPRRLDVHDKYISGDRVAYLIDVRP